MGVPPSLPRCGRGPRRHGRGHLCVSWLACAFSRVNGSGLFLLSLQCCGIRIVILSPPWACILLFRILGFLLRIPGLSCPECRSLHVPPVCLLPSFVEGATHSLCPPRTGFLVGAICVGVRGFPVCDRRRFAFRWGSWRLPCRQEHAEFPPSATTRYAFLHLPAFIGLFCGFATHECCLPFADVSGFRPCMPGFCFGHRSVADRGPMVLCARYGRLRLVSPACWLHADVGGAHGFMCGMRHAAHLGSERLDFWDCQLPNVDSTWSQGLRVHGVYIDSSRTMIGRLLEPAATSVPCPMESGFFLSPFRDFNNI